ncbi:MAG: sensor histidine kinase [Crocinitomicaceae bacterium]|nr:MAG: sensor histidine kinase [Crocinitomicaceae bacterium]
MNLVMINNLKVNFRKQFLLSILLLFGTAFTSLCFGQKVDFSERSVSILTRYVKLNDTTHVAPLLQYLDSNFSELKNLKIPALLEQVAKKSERSDGKYLDEVYGLLNRHYTQLGNESKAFEYFLKLYKTLTKTGKSDMHIWMMVDLGNVFYNEKDYEQATIFYKKAEQAAIDKKDNYALSVIYMNYGLIEFQLKRNEKALQFIRKSSNFRRLHGRNEFLSSNYIKMAEVFLKMKNTDSALFYIHEAERYFSYQKKNDPKLIDIPIDINLIYSHYYQVKKQQDRFMYHLLQARAIALKLNYKQPYFYTFFKESDFYIEQRDYLKAKKCLESILDELKATESIEGQVYVYQNLTTCYLKLGAVKEATESFDNFVQLKDSLNRFSVKSQLNAMRSISAVFDKDVKLQDARKNLEVAKMNSQLQQQQKQILYWVTGISVCLIFILLSFFLNLRKNKERLQQLHFKSLLQNNEIKIKSSELQRSDQIKDKLFSIIAHDLRNPLNRLLVELAIVKKTIANEKLLEPMENTLKETIGLFERLLQWSKMDNKQNVYSPIKINLNENINKIITFYLPEMQLRNIRVVNNSETFFVFVDPNVLQTLLRNFISNAIGILPKGGIIEIELILKEEDQVELLISDSGTGFPHEILENFFVEKNSIDSASNGLGLTLCKVLAKMSGWSIQLDNKSKHGGARVSIVLPIFKEKRRLKELNVIASAFEPDAYWKEKLHPMKEFKFYQTSPIRSFLKSLGEVDDPQVRLWIRQVENAVHQGDKDLYKLLINLIQ